jgi:hypothetical protein
MLCISGRSRRWRLSGEAGDRTPDGVVTFMFMFMFMGRPPVCTAPGPGVRREALGPRGAERRTPNAAARIGDPDEPERASQRPSRKVFGADRAVKVNGRVRHACRDDRRRRHCGLVAARGRRAGSRRPAGRSRSSGRRDPPWLASRTTRAPAGNPSRRRSTKIGQRATCPMITSNAEGAYSEDGKHTAPPGHDNNSACRPVSRHKRLIASRAASVTTRQPPRRSTRSQEPRECRTVIACQHLRCSHHNPPEKTPLARKAPMV